MALLLKVNGRDLTDYNRMAHGDGHEPASADSFEPQFTGSPALGEGQSFVGNSLGNVAMSFPLILSAATTDALYQLIRDIRTDLVKGNTVEYRSGGASQSTFFDMESGKLEPNFEFWLDQNAKCRAQLTIWRRPYGHTGTSRVIASAVGTGPMTITATGVLGDVDAQANLGVRNSGGGTGFQGPILYGVKYPAPSGFSPHWNASRMAAEGPGGGGATVITATSLASGRVSNSFLAQGNPNPLSGAGAIYTPFFYVPLPAQTYSGRYRVVANGRIRAVFTGANAKVEATLTALDDFGRRSAKTIPVPSSLGWTPWDLGEVSVPTTSGTSFNLTLSIQISSASALGSLVATHPIQMDGFSLIPLDSGGMLNGSPTAGQRIGVSASAITDIRGTDRSVTVSSGIGLGPSFTFEESVLRGDWPHIPPTGSPAASGVAQVVVWPSIFAATGGELISNREQRVTVAVRERFSYMR